jgi:hypothetical protein
MIKFFKKRMPINYSELVDPLVHLEAGIQQAILCTPN